MGRFGRREWVVRDNFGERWRLRVPRPSEPRASSLDARGHRFAIRHLVYGAFDSIGARGGDGSVARALLEAYDRLTGESFSDRLPDPQRDPHRLLSNFNIALRHTLQRAAESGRLVIDRVERLPWPFSELPQQPPPAPAPTEIAAEAPKSWIGIALVDQTGAPLPGRAYRIVAADGTAYEGSLAADGTAAVRDLDEGPCRVSCPYAAEHGSFTYTVKPGDHISGIAQSYGFDDYATVWNDPNNAPLAAQRTNPHELVEGDQVFIPALKDQPMTKPTGSQHTFVIQRSPLKLRVKVLGFDMQPLAGVSCTLDGASLTTDGDGLVEAPVDKLARVSFLSVQGVDLALQLGRLAPIDDDSDAGWKARLYNLGFLLDPYAQDGDEELRIALEDFQAQYGLPVTGTFDDDTMSQLQQSYGC